MRSQHRDPNGAPSSRDEFALAAVRPMLTVLTGLYAIFSLTHTFLLPPDQSAPMGVAAALTTVVLGGGRLLVGRRPPPPSLAHPIIAGVSALALANAVAHMAVAAEPHQTTSVMLVVVACGVFLLDRRWFAAMIVLALLTWGAVAVVIARGDPWAHYAFALLSSSVLAALIHAIRVRSIRSVTEQQARLARAATVARQSEERFRKLAEAAFEAVIVHRDGRIVDANASFTAMFGYRPDELGGGAVLDIVIPEERARVRDRIAAADEEPYETIGQRRDGSRIWLEVRARTLPYGDSEARVAALRDVSAQKEREAALAKALTELERSNEELERFAYVVSHDLQAPLRTIASFSEILVEDWGDRLDDEAREFFARIQAGVGRMRRLLRDLLAYSRVGTAEGDFEPVALDDVLDTALEDLAAALEESGGRVTREPLPSVVADEAQMAQVFSNLIGNALKFRSDEPPAIGVSARAAEGGIVFAVRDNGIGIEPRFAEGIFNVFERLHATGDYPGTGIGLAICKRIVERHGGRIWVESAPNEGATFHVFLPDRG